MCDWRWNKKMFVWKFSIDGNLPEIQSPGRNRQEGANPVAVIPRDISRQRTGTSTCSPSGWNCCGRVEGRSQGARSRVGIRREAVWGHWSHWACGPVVGSKHAWSPRNYSSIWGSAYAFPSRRILQSSLSFRRTADLAGIPHLGTMDRMR